MTQQPSVFIIRITKQHMAHNDLKERETKRWEVPNIITAILLLMVYHSYP